MSQGPFGNPPPGPPPKSGGSNTMMIIIVVGVVGLIACGGCCGVGGYFFYFVGKQVADLTFIQEDALKSIVANPEVQEKINTTAAQTKAPTTTFTDGLDSASMEYDLNGSNGTGTAIVSAQKQSGEWKVTSIEVTFADGSKTSIDPKAGKKPGEVNIPEIPEDLEEMESN